MKAIISTALMLFISVFGTAQTGGIKIKKTNNTLNKRSVMLPNGWSLTPAGRSLEVGDLPLNIAVSSSGSLMAVTNNGQGRQSCS
jgi:hypothetical protein